MRRTERIDEILAKIREEWIKIPDCRLGQLLVTKFYYPDNLLYGQEDDKFGVEVFDPNQPNGFEEFIKKVMSGVYNGNNFTGKK